MKIIFHSMENQESSQNKGYQKKPLPEEKRNNSGHHISNTEWGLVIGALALVDLAQIVLDIFAIGLVTNRLIDILIGGFLVLYTKLRCKNIGFGKTIMRTALTFIGEEIPVVDALPLWTLDGIYTMTLERAGEKAKLIETNVPGGKILTRKLQSNTSDRAGIHGIDEKNTAKTREPLQNIPNTQINPQTEKGQRAGPGRALELSNQKREESDRKDRGNLLELSRQIVDQGNRQKENPQTARERLEKFKAENADKGFDEGKFDEDYQEAA